MADEWGTGTAAVGRAGAPTGTPEPVGPEAARRTQTATILFTDLVGSTAMRFRVGDDVGEQIRQEHDALLTRAVADHGGETVKHLGDGIMAVFGAAGDAVAAGVTIQRSIARYNRRPVAGEPLAVRVGISAGDVQVDGTDCFGTPVVEAARLEGAARGGQVLVSQIVQVLAGSRSGFRFESVGELDLKGVPDPVAAAEVVWEEVALDGQLALPPGLAERDPEPFVGRRRERDALHEAWDLAAAGSRQLVLLGGDAGMGKTRLVGEVARELHEQGATVLFGRCDEGLMLPYQPFVEALRHYARGCADGELHRRLGTHAGDLVRLLPDLAERRAELPDPVSSDAEIEQYRLFEAVVAWLEAAVDAGGPIVLVVEDLHWATSHTTRLLRHVLDRAAELPLLVVATYRDGERDADPSFTKFLSHVHRTGAVHRLELGGLGREEVHRLLAGPGAAGGDKHELAVALWEQTAGNAFFVREVIRQLRESGALDGPCDGQAIRAMALPESIKDMISQRLDRLSPDAHAVLAVASVMGLDFDLQVLAVVVDLDEQARWAALTEAEEAGIIGEGALGRCAFSHALVQAALYEELSYTRRVRLHQRVGDALERVYGARLPSRHGELAYHFDRAGAIGDPHKAIHYATLAGRHALHQYANEEAAHFFSIAMRYLEARPDELDDGERRALCDLKLSLGRAQARLARPEHRTTLREAARLAVELGDLAAATHAVVSAGRAFASTVGEVDFDQVELLEAALALAGDDDSPERAMLLARLGAELSYAVDLETPMAVTVEAVEVARRTGDKRALAFVLATRYAAVWQPDMASNELRALAAEIGDPGLAFLAEHERSNEASWKGDDRVADAAFEIADAMVDEIGDRRAVWLVELTRAKQAMMHGDLEAAEQLSQVALELGQSSRQPDAFSFYASQLLALRWLGCRHGELVDLVDAADEAMAALPAFRAARALIHLEVGRRDEARRTFDGLAALGFDRQPVAGNPVVPLFVLGQLCADLGDSARAAELLEVLDPHRDLHAASVNLWLGPASHPRARLLALVGRDLEADEAFEEARAIYGDRGCRPMRALAGVHWAEALQARGAGHEARVRALLDEALVVAQEFELDALTERARAVASVG